MSKDLLFSITKNDLRIDDFYAGGPGGQNQNKRKTGIRITHVESGAVGEARDSRSQDQNKSAAFKRMIWSEKFQTWFRNKIDSSMGTNIMHDVDLDNEIIKTYHFPNGWVKDHRTGEKKRLKDVLDGKL